MKRFTARARLLKGAVLTFMLALTLLGTLLPGAALAAPSGVAAPTAITKPAEWNGGNCSTWYTVQFGDSLSSIAVRFGTSVNALMQANGIWNPNRVLVGQTLCIPGGWNPHAPTTSTVRQLRGLALGETRPDPQRYRRLVRRQPLGTCPGQRDLELEPDLRRAAALYSWRWRLASAATTPKPPPCQPEPCGNPCGQPCPLPPPPPPPPPLQFRARRSPARSLAASPAPCRRCIGAWNGEYFNNRDLAAPPTFVRQDPNIAFDWGTWGPGDGVGPNNFSVRWTKVENFDGGNYRFWATVDDGVRIWVDDQLIIDYWRVGPATTVQCDHYLSPGPHTIKVEYFQAEGVAVIYVKYARL